MHDPSGDRLCLALEDDGEPVEEVLDEITVSVGQHVLDELVDRRKVGVSAVVVRLREHVGAGLEHVDAVLDLIDDPVVARVVLDAPDRDELPWVATVALDPVVELALAAGFVELQALLLRVPQAVVVLGGLQVAEGQDEVTVVIGRGGERCARLDAGLIVAGHQFFGAIPAIGLEVVDELEVVLGMAVRPRVAAIDIEPHPVASLLDAGDRADVRLVLHLDGTDPGCLGCALVEPARDTQFVELGALGFLEHVDVALTDALDRQGVEVALDELDALEERVFGGTNEDGRGDVE